MALQNQLSQFNVKTFKIKGIEVLPQALNNFNIFESLTHPGIYGYFTVADWQGFDEVGEIFGGDLFEVIFKTDDGDELSLKYTIYSNSLKVDPGLSYNTVTYNFCSTWLVDGFSRQVSKHYKNKYVHEIITDLLIECGATIGYVEPTKQKLTHFTTPLWTAIHSINHLTTFALSKQDVGGYVIWTDMKTDKVYCTTIDYLYKGKHGILDKPFTTIAINPIYENRVESITLENSFDIIRHTNVGMANTKFQTYNYDTGKIVSTTKKANEVPHYHLSSKMPLNSKFGTDKYVSLGTCFNFPSTDILSTKNMHEDLYNGKLNTRYANLFTDVFRVNLLSNPTSTRRAGNVVYLNYQTQDYPKNLTDKQYTGQYVIRDIRHLIHNGNYMQAITIMNDGYKISANDLIKWKNNELTHALDANLINGV
jgi:hypothetical protein